MMNLTKISDAIRAQQEVYDALSRNLKAILNATLKKVTVQIDPEDLTALKENGFRLCFAKKVGDNDYNVVWQSYKDFNMNNEFSWQPMYQMFITNTFKSGVTVKVRSNTVSIGLGECTTVNDVGLLSKPISGGDKSALNLENDYQKTHVGVSQQAIDLNGNLVSNPIYVSEEEFMKGSAEFKPVEKVMIWFEKNVETSTMFADMRSNSYEVDLTLEDEIVVQYKDEEWSIVK